MPGLYLYALMLPIPKGIVRALASSKLVVNSGMAQYVSMSQLYYYHWVGERERGTGGQ